jgi:hypothetical protein
MGRADIIGVSDRGLIQSGAQPQSLRLRLRQQSPNRRGPAAVRCTRLRGSDNPATKVRARAGEPDLSFTTVEVCWILDCPGLVGLAASIVLRQSHVAVSTPLQTASRDHMPARVRSRILYWLVRKFAHACTFRHLGRQCCGIIRLKAVSAIFIIRIDGYYAFDCRGAGCPTLDFRTKWSQHQRRLHLRNIGAEEAAKNHEPKHRNSASGVPMMHLAQNNRF